MDINPSASILTSLYPGAAVVDARSRIVLPGFVNAHFHGESVLLRAITRRSPYAAWKSLTGLREAEGRLLDPSSAQDVATLYRIAGYLHTRSGTTTVAEYPSPYAPRVLEAAAENFALAGLRSVFALRTWEQTEFFRNAPAGSPRHALSLGAEDDYTVYSLESLVRASAGTQFPLVAHLGETRADVDALRTRFKKSPLRILKDAGALTPATHLIHCNHVPDRDLDIIREIGSPVTLCVRSTVAKQTGYPLLRALASRDVMACLGTDWGETDLLGEIRVLRNLRKYVPGTPSFTPLELIRMATINGAHALGVSSHTGSLEVGKHADLVMIPSDDIRFPPLGAHPTAEQTAEIVTDYCDTGMISDVMVEGTFRVRDSADQRTDGAEVLRDFRILQDVFLPPPARAQEGIGAAGVPFLQPPAGEKAPLLGHDESGEGAPRESGANIRPPGPPADDTLQKFPVITKKIGKIFGENDI
ncbi:MAG TPA: amidohydrolase family protein [Bacteroidota bacterium]|nr:amidohydrolase family protein [Bacteroidota bacterium]